LHALAGPDPPCMACTCQASLDQGCFHLKRNLIMVCRACARELRRLESTTAAPILSAYRDAQKGAAVARSLRITHHLLRRLDAAIDQHTAATLCSAALSQWLALRLQLLSALLIAGLAFLAVAGASLPWLSVPSS
jgi:hypothetical protein